MGRKLFWQASEHNTFLTWKSRWAVPSLIFCLLGQVHIHHQGPIFFLSLSRNYYIKRKKWWFETIDIHRFRLNWSSSVWLVLHVGYHPNVNALFGCHRKQKGHSDTCYHPTILLPGLHSWQNQCPFHDSKSVLCWPTAPSEELKKKKKKKRKRSSETLSVLSYTDRTPDSPRNHRPEF